jgi:16S rRNA (guanine1207-N2)-methyltransferase
MGRWADNPEKAADELMRRSLEGIALSGRLLLVNQHGDLPALLRSRGAGPQVWNRRSGGGTEPQPWPPAGPFETALVRLPKARDEQDMTLHAALSVLQPEGRLILYGGNDEGIRSAATRLSALCGAADTLAARGHGRVVAAARPEEIAGLKSELSQWRTVATHTIAGVARPWVSYPGLFAAGRIDEGTALLISTLAPVPAGARVLDFGCGTGVIAAAVLAASPGARLDMMDEDTLALEAARENVPGANILLGRSLSDAGKQLYRAIVSNPPLHQGIAETHASLERLVREAPAYLAPGGTLQIVVQRRVPLDGLLAQIGTDVKVVAENGRYRVWRVAARGP